jgi:surface protein
MSKYIEVFSKGELQELLTKNPKTKYIRIMFEDLDYLYFNVLQHVDPDFEVIDISNWDVSRVTNMSRMFDNAESFNQDISNWDVSRVRSMSCMFSYAKSFNQDIGGWDTSNVRNMNSMFWSAESFNSYISNWDVGNVTNMSYMFWYAESFNQDLSNWNVGNVENIKHMFKGSGLKIVPSNYKLLEGYYSE